MGTAPEAAGCAPPPLLALRMAVRPGLPSTLQSSLLLSSSFVLGQNGLSHRAEEIPLWPVQVLFLNSSLETVSVLETRNGLYPTLILGPRAEVPWVTQQARLWSPSPGQFLPPVCACRQAPIQVCF